MNVERRAVIVVLVVAATLALSLLAAIVLADTVYADWITIQRQVKSGDTYPLLDARYGVPPGTVSTLNSGARLVPGSWIAVPVKASPTAGQPSQYKRTRQPRFPGYPPGYRPSVWR